MAASSRCRRKICIRKGSSLDFRQKESAALNQSRRTMNGRVNMSATRRLFSFAVVRQNVFY